MCILFVAVNDHANANEYKLVLASNRDEFYSRKTRPAHFWENAPHILGGMDMEPGREGGTWLAVNTVNGRIGALLNITTSNHCVNKRGRGSIVTDFLETENPLQTVRKLKEDAKQYNPFNFIMIDRLTAPVVDIAYYASVADADPCLLHPNGVYGFGNSVMSTPFQKVQDGRNKFEAVVQSCPTTETQEQLTACILEILKSTDRHLPDPQLQQQAAAFSRELQVGLSCRFVYVPQMGYGSRTHTIIYVTGDNRMTFEEWTMEEPIDALRPQWTHSSFTFQIPKETFE